MNARPFESNSSDSSELRDSGPGRLRSETCGSKLNTDQQLHLSMQEQRLNHILCVPSPDCGIRDPGWSNLYILCTLGVALSAARPQWQSEYRAGRTLEKIVGLIEYKLSGVKQHSHFLLQNDFCP
jgi:hypothetical protein